MLDFAAHQKRSPDARVAEAKFAPVSAHHLGDKGGRVSDA
jgi:hypothetical protein